MVRRLDSAEKKSCTTLSKSSDTVKILSAKRYNKIRS